MKRHSKYDFAMALKVTWSKNVREFRACPDQILLGSLNIHFCVLLHLALYLEEWIEDGNAVAGYDEAFLFSSKTGKNWKGEDFGPISAKTIYRKTLAAVYSSEAFLVVSCQMSKLKLGSHSLRKFAATFAKHCGSTTSEIEERGRWKGCKSNSRVVEGSYISQEQPYIDASVAHNLADCLSCAYRPHPAAAGVTRSWLKKHVVRFTHEFYGGDTNPENPSMTLAYPLLWAAMDDRMEGRMNPEMRSRIRAEYAKIDTLPEGTTNPVVRVHLLVSRNRNELVIEEMRGASFAVPGAPAVPGALPTNPTTPTTTPYLQSHHSQAMFERVLNQLQVQQEQMVTNDRNMHAVITTLTTNLEGRFSTINQNLCR
jgi:hypothetical protein